MGVRYAREGLWDKQAQMFQRALFNDGMGHWQQAGGFEIGWCGRNGDLANGLLMDYLRNHEQQSRDIGIACLDTWAARAGPLYAVSSQEPQAPPVGSVSAEAVRPFLGQWKVTYNNGAVANLNFLPNGRISDSPHWGTGSLRATAEGLSRVSKVFAPYAAIGNGSLTGRGSGGVLGFSLCRAVNRKASSGWKRAKKPTMASCTASRLAYI